MTRAERATALILAALLGGAAAAAPPVLPKASFAPAPADPRAIAAQALDKARGGDCAGALALLDPLVASPPAGIDANALQLLRMPCLAEVGRGDEAAALQARLATVLPKNEVVLSYGVLMSAAAGRFDEAARRLETIATTQPEALRLVSGTSWRGIAQKLTEARETDLRGRVSVALARVDWQPVDRPEMRDLLAQDAIQVLLADKQLSEAGLLLDRIATPELLFDMATERSYAPLWPGIETRMGAAQAKSVDRFAASAFDAFSRADSDIHARRDAVRAFVLLGRLDDAAQLAAPIRIRDGMDEDEVGIVHYHAQVLSAQGRRDAAVERLKPFATLDLAKTPQGASGIVELAETLDEAGRPAEALAVARGVPGGAADPLSGWGRGWLNRTEVCALTALKRPAEAKQAGDALLAAAATNEAAAIEGLLCAGRDGEAAKLAVATLATPEGASRIADQFQPGDALWAAGHSRLRALWSPLLARPDVRAAFEKSARILPKRLWPATTPRPIPRVAAPDDAPTT